MDPIRVLLSQIPSGGNISKNNWITFGSTFAVPSGYTTFSIFQNGGLPVLNWKCQTPFSRHNKMERIKWTPYGFCFRSVPSGDKTFSGFQKGGIPVLIWKCQTPFSIHNKMERITNGPHTGSAFAESLRGIKHFQGLKKADYQFKIESPIYVS